MRITLLDMLFGCWHSNFSFPQKRGKEHYVCCLECGKEFSYSWQEMKIVKDVPDAETAELKRMYAVERK